MMCIYYKDRNDLTYDNREHIFSQAVGGMKKLPQGYVSDQANILFSKMELTAFRRSFIALNRMIIGPGKEGSVANKLTSPVSIIVYENGDFGLGYINNLKEYLIPYGYLHNGKLRLGCNAEDGIQKINQAIIEIKDYSGRIIRLVEPSIPQEALLFGIHNNILYIGACDDTISNEKAHKIITEVIILTENQERNLSSRKSPGKHHIAIQEDNNISRVYGKTALNVLAFIAGVDYALNPSFDNFRNWILTGDNMNEYSKLPMIGIEKITFPEKSHWCLLLNIDDKLCAVVCYHNSMKRIFNLGNNIDNRFSMPDGFICDWHNKQEYLLIDWIQQMPAKMKL